MFTAPLLETCPEESRQNQKKIHKVLVTGASGYLGRSLCGVMGENFDLVRMDISEVAGPGSFFMGSVTDREVLSDACQGVDALILAHMAPNRTEAYDWPDRCMDVNVKGLALALEAAVRHGIRRVVVVSSVAVVWGHALRKTYLSRDLSPEPTDLYGMTKVLQEEIARFYHRSHGLEVALLRPAYILREDSLIDKYGENRPAVTWQCIDPRDIGRAAGLALQIPDLQFEAFYLMAGPDAEKHVDLSASYVRLGWTPKHRFLELPIENI
jgi:nucleoside-diphosphate-sugar epimerase